MSRRCLETVLILNTDVRVPMLENLSANKSKTVKIIGFVTKLSIVLQQ